MKNRNNWIVYKIMQMFQFAIHIETTLSEIQILVKKIENFFACQETIMGSG